MQIIIGTKIPPFPNNIRSNRILNYSVSILEQIHFGVWYICLYEPQCFVQIISDLFAWHLTDLSFVYTMLFWYVGFPLLNLTLVAIRSCASYVSLQHTTLRRLHLGLNSDSLYLAIAKEFNAWNTTEFSSYSHSTFYGWAYYRYNAGLSGTLVNPSNENSSCANTILSSAPDPSYVSPYTLPTVISYLTSVQPNNCVPEVNTPFCVESESFRKEAIEEVLEVCLCSTSCVLRVEQFLNWMDIESLVIGRNWIVFITYNRLLWLF